MLGLEAWDGKPYRNPVSMQNNGPEPPKPAQKATIQHTLGVQVHPKTITYPGLLLMNLIEGLGFRDWGILSPCNGESNGKEHGKRNGRWYTYIYIPIMVT